MNRARYRRAISQAIHIISSIARLAFFLISGIRSSASSCLMTIPARRQQPAYAYRTTSMMSHHRSQQKRRRFPHRRTPRFSLDFYVYSSAESLRREGTTGTKRRSRSCPGADFSSFGSGYLALQECDFVGRRNRLSPAVPRFHSIHISAFRCSPLLLPSFFSVE